MARESRTSIVNGFDIENKNYLSPSAFLLIFNKLPGITFMCQKTNIPGISTGVAIQPTRLNKVPHPSDELRYEDLEIEFLIDENLKNWVQLHDWLRGITNAVRADEFIFNRGKIQSPYEPRPDDINKLDPELQERSEATLIILSSNYQPVCNIVYHDVFPTAVSPLPFDTTVNDIRYLTARALFSYTYYDIEVQPAANATDETMGRFRYSYNRAVVE